MSDIQTEITAVKAEVLTALKDLQTKHEERVKELRESKASNDEFRKEFDSVREQVAELNATLKRPGSGKAVDGIDYEKPIGQRIFDAPEFQEFKKRGKHRGGISVPVGAFEQKTTIDSSAVGSVTSAILVPQRVPGYVVDPADRRLRVRELLPSRTIGNNNAVEWVKENAFTNNASYQVEAADKVESALTFTIDSAGVKTIAHWIPATRQVLDDWTELDSIIRNRMMYGLKKKEDLEILFGDGLGSHLTGLTVDATAFAGTYNVASDTYIDKILRALTELEATSEYQATGIVVNPADWRKMQSIKEDVSAANTGQYILGGPRTQGPMQLWDVPVVTTTAMTVGRFLVGDFQQAGEIFDRMDATVDISTEHSDYFIKNLVAVRIEERLALAVYRPNAMRYGSF